MVDPVKNFAVVTVSTGYDDVATSIVLSTGDGLKLPDPVADGSYNLTWYDSTSYSDPSADPNVEIWRVTGPSGTGDTKTGIRAQEGTSATTKNAVGHAYKMILAPTKKTITDLAAPAESAITFTDISANDVSITKHGFVPKGTNLGKYLKDDGTWATSPNKPAGQIFLSSAGGWPSTTSGSNQTALTEQSNNKVNMWSLDFDYNTTKYAEFTLVMPSDWDGGTVTATFYWMANDTTTNSVTWYIQGRSYGDGEAIDQAWGTAVSVSDANASTANQLRKSAATAAMTFAGTPAAGELAQFRVYRTTGDTLTVSAKLIGVMINFTRT